MKKLVYLLLAMPLFFTSCSKEEMASNETVQVSFCAELPQQMGTRAANGLTVDRVVCAVFENGDEIKDLRETITITDGKEIVYAPRLIKGRTYDVVFWAMKDGYYNVENLTNITRNTGNNLVEAEFDAFTAVNNITVSNAESKEVTLTRPFAQLNIGVTQEDWTTVTEKFNLTPTATTLSLTAKSAFNALTGVATGEDATLTYNLTVSDENISVNNVSYKSIASCYVLPDQNKENFDVTLGVFADADRSNAIRNEITIESVPLQSNYKTNVVGGLLAGTITYQVNINQAFADTSNDKPIE